MTASRPGVRVKRVYEASEPGDGFRVLVDRLWPRGLTKEKARVDLWLKEVAPSTGLRQWFHKNVDRWPEFKERYEEELAENPALDELRALSREHGKRNAKGLTLLYAARAMDQNHATVLLEMLGRSPGR